MPCRASQPFVLYYYSPDFRLVGALCWFGNRLFVEVPQVFGAQHLRDGCFRRILGFLNGGLTLVTLPNIILFHGLMLMFGPETFFESHGFA